MLDGGYIITAINSSGDTITINGITYTVSTTLTQVVKPVPKTPSWNPAVTDLVFEDDFTGTELNPAIWANSWFKGGEMNDVTTSPSNVTVADSYLILTLSSPKSGALVNSDPGQINGGGFQFGAGYSMEASILFPGFETTVYNWPAFWTDGQNWPDDGEIDVAEGLGELTSNYHSTVGATNSGAIPGTWAGGFHTYGLDRAAGMNYIYWDGELVDSYPTDDGGAPHYIIFNIGVGDKTELGVISEVMVDWVRVWKN